MRASQIVLPLKQCLCPKGTELGVRIDEPKEFSSAGGGKVRGKQGASQIPEVSGCGRFSAVCPYFYLHVDFKVLGSVGWGNSAVLEM